MSNYWTLHVKDFAKIREAKIEAAPLTLFVGDNNSGKSYLLSLLWGLTGGVDFSHQALTWERNGGIKLDEVQNLLDSWKTRNYGGLTEDSGFPSETENMWSINAEEQGILIKGINTFLATVKDDVVNEIFNSDEVYAKSICLDIPFGEGFRFGFHKQSDRRDDYGRWRLEKTLSYSDNPNFSSFLVSNASDYIGRCIDFAFDKSVFIPAPRTGFLLTFPVLTQGSIRFTFGMKQTSRAESKFSGILTDPHVSYLERLTSLRKEKTRKIRPIIQNLLDFVEQNIISGKIDITNTPLPEILYKPKGLDQTLPLCLSSGVVTEVAGFLSLLKFGQFCWTCIYEEPEMGLHPELQWKMARVLVKLVNAGCTVWASTHSDIITQHVNNMVKLSNYPDREREQLQKERGYDEDDIISSDKVRMYQFDVASDHKTDVRPLECGINGFRVPTFGKVFREMQDDVWNLRHEVKEAK
jgi:energy-coupling factor transporter ATP-binding protein EcfA2